jgi:hypothetical protein
MTSAHFDTYVLNEIALKAASVKAVGISRLTKMAPADGRPADTVPAIAGEL